MKTQKIVITLALIAAAFAVTSCKLGLLNVGLGDKVDILPPGISIVPTDGVQNGAYVHGTVTVNGEVSDDVGVSSVTWMFTDDATSTMIRRSALPRSMRGRGKLVLRARHRTNSISGRLNCTQTARRASSSR